MPTEGHRQDECLSPDSRASLPLFQIRCTGGTISDDPPEPLIPILIRAAGDQVDDSLGLYPVCSLTEHPHCQVQATIPHLPGIAHARLTFRHNGIDRRLTDVQGHVIREIPASDLDLGFVIRSDALQCEPTIRIASGVEETTE